MKLKEIDMQNEFITIIEADWNDADYITKSSTFENSEFEEISALITIMQDIYKKQKSLQKTFKNHVNIGEDIEEYIRIYLSRHFNNDTLNIIDDAVVYITERLYDFMPATNDDEYYYPHTICDIKIIKDSKVFEAGQPTDDDIKKALKFISTLLQEE